MSLASEMQADLLGAQAEAGQIIYYMNPNESQVLRDSDSDVAGQPPTFIELCAFPCYINPGQKQIERAGMKEGISAIFWVSAQTFTCKISTKPPDIMRHRIIMRNPGGEVMRSFTIDQAHYKNTNPDGFMYVVIGCVEST